MKGNSGPIGFPERRTSASTREELLMLGIKQMRCIVFINSKALLSPRFAFSEEKGNSIFSSNGNRLTGKSRLASEFQSW
jgi:hypothetical protein